MAGGLFTCSALRDAKPKAASGTHPVAPPSIVSGWALILLAHTCTLQCARQRGNDVARAEAADFKNGGPQWRHVEDQRRRRLSHFVSYSQKRAHPSVCNLLRNWTGLLAHVEKKWPWTMDLPTRPLRSTAHSSRSWQTLRKNPGTRPSTHASTHTRLPCRALHCLSSHAHCPAYARCVHLFRGMACVHASITKHHLLLPAAVSQRQHAGSY